MPRPAHAALLVVVAAALAPAGLAQPVRVLFIGNSFVAVNDLPGTFAAVAKSKGREVEVSAIAPGGCTLQTHASNAPTLAEIKKGRWDFVVLQEQSQRPSWPAGQVEEQVMPYALRLDAFIRAHQPGATTVFYGTWGYKNGDATNCRDFPEVCAYEGMQERLTQTYSEMARRTGGRLAPVGTAWSKVRRAHPDIELYGDDGIHPSVSGTYLAACVLYATIFGKGTAGAAAPGLDPAQAVILQTASMEAAFALRRK